METTMTRNQAPVRSLTAYERMLWLGRHPCITPGDGVVLDADPETRADEIDMLARSYTHDHA
jgi:hypothetical protein